MSNQMLQMKYHPAKKEIVMEVAIIKGDFDDFMAMPEYYNAASKTKITAK